MGKKKEGKPKLQRRVSELLDRAASSPVAVAARCFRESGFEVQLGRCVLDAEQRHHGIEMIARARKTTPGWDLEASWHIAHAPGNDDVLVVLNEKTDQKDDDGAIGFHPLANDLFDQILKRTRGKYTGIGLLDAPKVKADGLVEVLGEKGVGGKDYRSMLRALDSALHALRPTLEPFQETRPFFRFAVPALVTDAEMFEACATGRTARLAETCYIALEHEFRGPRTVDVVGTEFLKTYAKMAGEAVEALPRLIGEQSEKVRETGPVRHKDLVDAWDAFRQL